MCSVRVMLGEVYCLEE
jgi:hypothetical protein